MNGTGSNSEARKRAAEALASRADVDAARGRRAADFRGRIAALTERAEKAEAGGVLVSTPNPTSEQVARAIDPEAWRLFDTGTLPPEHPGAVALVRRSLERAAAVMALLPVAPTPERIAALRDDHWMAQTDEGWECGGCEWEPSDPEVRQTHRGMVAHCAHVGEVLAAGWQTVAQVKAEALREAADEFAQEVAANFAPGWLHARADRIERGEG